MTYTKRQIMIHRAILWLADSCENISSSQCRGTDCAKVVEIQATFGPLYNLSYLEFLIEVLSGKQRAVVMCHDTGKMFPVVIERDELLGSI